VRKLSLQHSFVLQNKQVSINERKKKEARNCAYFAWQKNQCIWGGTIDKEMLMRVQQSGNNYDSATFMNRLSEAGTLVCTQQGNGSSFPLELTTSTQPR
jgi:hypothetical protein